MRNSSYESTGRPPSSVRTAPSRDQNFVGQEVTEPKSDFSSAKKLLYGQNQGRNGGFSTPYPPSDQSTLRRGRNLGGKRRVFNPPYKKNEENPECFPEKRNKLTHLPSVSISNAKSKKKEKERNPIFDDERLNGLDPEIVEKILVEILEQRVNSSWEDIAGLSFAKDTVKEIVIAPMLRPDIFTGLRAPPKGILLFGPPGTGKSYSLLFSFSFETKLKLCSNDWKSDRLSITLNFFQHICELVNEQVDRRR